jgi:hypothetical protein
MACINQPKRKYEDDPAANSLDPLWSGRWREIQGRNPTEIGGIERLLSNQLGSFTAPPLLLLNVYIHIYHIPRSCRQKQGEMYIVQLRFGALFENR